MSNAQQTVEKKVGEGSLVESVRELKDSLPLNELRLEEEIQCFESSTGSLYAVDREMVKNSRKPSFSDDLDEIVKIEASDSGVSVEPVDPGSVEFEDLTSINRTRGVD